MEGLRVTLSRSATGKRTRFSVPACGKRSFPGRAPLAGGCRAHEPEAWGWGWPQPCCGAGGCRGRSCSAHQAAIAWNLEAAEAWCYFASVVGCLEQNGPVQLLVVPVLDWEPGPFEKRVSLQGLTNQWERSEGGWSGPREELKP